MLGIPVTIVTPIDAPPIKIGAIRDAGAEVVLSDHGDRNREEAASELAVNLVRERGATALHPFDDPVIVAGRAALLSTWSNRRGGRATVWTLCSFPSAAAA